MKITKKKISLAKSLKLLGYRALHNSFISKASLFLFVFFTFFALDSLLQNHQSLLIKRSLNKPHKPSLSKKKQDKKNSTSSPKTKWWNEEHLSLYGANLTQSLIDREFSGHLAKKASQRARWLNSKGNCHRAVKFSLWNTLAKLKNKREFLDLNKLPCDPGNHPYKYQAGLSAEHFRKWASENPISLFRELHLADVSNIPGLKIEKGFILVYKKGLHGFHKRYGHIEIVTKTKPLTVCSDHCSKARKNKKPSLILAPVKNYAPLYTFEDHSSKSFTQKSI